MITTDPVPAAAVSAVAEAPLERRLVEPDLVVAYSASSQGFLEPCGCAVRETELGGIARRATVVDSLRAEGAPVLLLEAGDFVGGGGPAGERVGRVSLEVMRAMRYDAVALGEAELRLGAPFLEVAAAAGVPLAHANWSHPAVGPAQREGLLLDKGELRVGIIGLLDPEALPPDLGLENLAVDPPAAAAARAAAGLRSRGADLIVVLGHTDFRRSGRLAGEGGAPDLWVVGHGGKELASPARVEGTLLLGPGNAGKWVGVLGLDMEEEGVARFANLLYPLRLTIPEKPAIAAILQRLEPALRQGHGAAS